MNLSQTSIFFRRTVNIIGALIVIYLVGKLSWPLLQSTYSSLNPPKDPPTVKYGLLEPLEFVEKKISGNVREIRLNTTDNRLPTGIPNKLPVYPIVKPPFSYQAGKNAQENAEILGFTEDELTTDLKGSTFRWEDQDTNSTLEININTKELLLDGRIVRSEANSLFSRAQARSEATRTLNQLGRLTDFQYTRQDPEITLGKIGLGNSVTKTENDFEANIARVDFFRNVGDYPILGPDPTKGLINVTVANTASTIKHVKVPKIDYHQWELVNDPSGTYPIITPAQAWNAVANEGQGIITSVVPIDSSIFSTYSPVRIDTVLVNRIYIAYYDTPERQDYLQPIYVFEGDYNVSNRPGGEIVIYYPAVAGQYYKAPAEN